VKISKKSQVKAKVIKKNKKPEGSLNQKILDNKSFSKPCQMLLHIQVIREELEKKYRIEKGKFQRK